MDPEERQFLLTAAWLFVRHGQANRARVLVEALVEEDPRDGVSAAALEKTEGMVSVITDNARMFMPMAELVDLEKERERIQKELANAEKQLAGQNAKLANQNFVTRAPEAVVNVEREKKAKLEALIENLKLSLENLGK